MLLCALDTDIFNQVYGKGELKYKPFILSSSNLHMLGYSCFSKTIKIPESFTVGDTCYKIIGIEPGAFDCCKEVETLYIPNSVIDMSHGMFLVHEFPSLKKVYIDNYENALPSGNRIFEVSDENKHIEFIWMRGVNEKDFHINDDGVLLGVSDVGRENYKEFHEKHNKLFGESYCRTTISSKRIGQDIKIIADFAFMGELDYTDSLTIEDVLIIGEGAFAVNPNLRFLEIGSSVLCISESCFEKNDMLENVTIPNTVRYIFNTIFYDCKSILSINVSEDTSIIGWQGGKVQEVERNMVMWDSYTDTNRYIIAV